MLTSIVIGALVAGVVGYLVGLIALRRTGIYFAMITVAIAEVFFFVEFNPLSDFTGGENGLPGVPTPSFNLGFTKLRFDSDWSMYVFLAFWYFVGLVIALRIVRSPVGAILSALRDNPLRAAALGHNIHGYKLTAFVVAAAYAGFAGGLLAIMQGFMPPDAFMFDTSGQLVMQTAIGGAGTLFGPLVGATVWLYLSDFFQNTLHLGATWRLVLGIVFVLLVCFLRRGIVGAIVDLYRLAAGVEEGEDARQGDCRTDRLPEPPLQVIVATAAGAAAERSVRTDSSGDGPDQALWRPHRQQRHRFRRQSRGNTRHYRAEWSGQKHFLQDADLRDRADVRQDRVRRPRHHGHERHRRLPARAHQKLPDQSAFRSADGQAEPDGRGAGADPRQVQT